MSKRDQILQTAVELFVRQGVENTPTSQISKVSGVATGTLFHHFPTKEALVRALVLETKASLHARVAEALSESGGFKPALQAMWAAQIRWAMAHPALFRLKTRMETLVDIDAQTRAELDAMWGEILGFIASGMANGQFKTMPEDYLFGALNAQVAFAAEYFIENPKAFADDRLRDQAFESAWASVAA
jgi:AcrR family transcriptional regulator